MTWWWGEGRGAAVGLVGPGPGDKVWERGGGARGGSFCVCVCVRMRAVEWGQADRLAGPPNHPTKQVGKLIP